MPLWAALSGCKLAGRATGAEAGGKAFHPPGPAGPLERHTDGRHHHIYRSEHACFF